MFRDRNQFKIGGHQFDVPQLPGHRPGQLLAFHEIEIEKNLWVAAIGADGWASYDFVVIKDGKILEAGQNQWGSSWKALGEGLAWCMQSGY